MKALAFAVAAAAVCAPAALASPVAEVLSSSGAVVATAETGAYAYPASGAVLRIGSSSIGTGAVTLDDVSLLGGRVTARSVTVFLQSRTTQIQGLVVDGHPVTAGVNGIVPLADGAYLVTSQTAIAGGAVGIVGLRLTVGGTTPGLPAGTQILVGLPARPDTARRSPQAAGAAAANPLALFAFSAAVSGAALPPLLTSPLAPMTVGDQAAALAERYLGVPYVWGGASPTTGFDCSGLAMYVYAQLGIALTHYSGAQYDEGMPVAPTQLQPGDLVFFEPSAAGPQHEGIYVGNNEFVQAPHTGAAVTVSSLATPAYALSYVGAVRPTR
jgi:cell wall-associated NlpC family hydrolase